MAISSFLFGKKPTLEQVPRLAPQQQQLLNLLSQQAQNQLGQPRQSVSELFQPIRQQAQQSLQERGIPSLLNQFVKGGGLGSHQQFSALSKAQSDLEGQLAAQEAQATLGREGQENQQLLQLLGLALQPQFDTIEHKGTEGLFGSPTLEGGGRSLLKLLPFLFGVGGSVFGGPAGGAAGSAIGSGLASLLPTEETYINKLRDQGFRSQFGGAL